jgi:hypothetical protein
MTERDELDPVREDLIASLYSDAEAKARLKSSLTEDFARALVHICQPYDYYSNDPRMEAAYYLSLCPIEGLHTVVNDIGELLELTDDGETMNGNISFHLLRCIDRLVNEAGYVPSPQLQAAMKPHAA